MPFDISVEKYQVYDLSATEAILEFQEATTQQLRKISEINEDKEPPASIVSIYELLKSIDRNLKVGGASANTGARPATGPVGSQEDLFSAFKDPKDLFSRALRKGDAEAAALAAVRWASKGELSADLLQALATVSQTGADGVSDAVQLFSAFDPSDDDGLRALGASAWSLASNATFNLQDSDFLENIERLLESCSFSLEVRAWVANQIGVMLWKREEHIGSLNWTEKALKLYDENPAFHYNLSVSLEKLKGPLAALESAEKAVELGADDEMHIDHLVDVYAALEEFDKAQATNERLADLNPARAQYNRRQYSLTDGAQ